MTITARIIADSVSPVPGRTRLTTLQLRYPKFIHGEFMTHRVFSRNASSSRAIPVDRLIKDIIDDPVIPTFWGKNQPGMQAHEECNELIYRHNNSKFDRESAWMAALEEAIFSARAFSKAGYHKQIVNRLLEPFCHINVVVTATEWSNFFALRCHPDAQPEIRILAESIRKVMDESKPARLYPGQWHLPYVSSYDALDRSTYHQDRNLPDITKLIKLSVARCARVSYLTQDGREPNVEEDLKLYDRLVSSVPLHASPCEHQGTPDRHFKEGGWSGNWFENSHLHGNFRGWIQYRKTLPGECQ
jgi:thymidylate synthase ThyX